MSAREAGGAGNYSCARCGELVEQQRAYLAEDEAFYGRAEVYSEGKRNEGEADGDDDDGEGNGQSPAAVGGRS